MPIKGEQSRQRILEESKSIILEKVEIPRF